MGNASSKAAKSSNPGPLPPDFIAFLASALFCAIASLILKAFPGLGGGVASTSGFGLEGVVARAEIVLGRATAAPGGASLDLTGVEGGLIPERDDEGCGIRDIEMAFQLKLFSGLGRNNVAFGGLGAVGGLGKLCHGKSLRAIRVDAFWSLQTPPSAIVRRTLNSQVKRPTPLAQHQILTIPTTEHELALDFPQ